MYSWDKYKIVVFWERIGDQMASLSLGPKALLVSLSVRERALLGRPSLSLELSRIRTVDIAAVPGGGKLGVRVSKRPIFGGLTGEWRSGSSRILVLGSKSGVKALKISLLHPTIDEIWYSGSDIEKLAAELKAVSGN